MLISIFGYIFLFFGLLILALPLILVELSRPRDWLIGGLCLCLGLFLLVENDLLRGSINLLVVSMTILFVIMMSEIIQNRWFQLSFDEKKLIRSFARWLESFKQIGQIFALLGKNFLNFFQSFRPKSEKSVKEKKWVHPDLQFKIANEEDDQPLSIESNKIENQELTENEETS